MHEIESEADAADNNQILYCGVVLEDDKAVPFYQAYYVPASSMGHAIAKILELSKSAGLSKPSIVECDPWWLYEDDKCDGEDTEIQNSINATGFFQSDRAFFDEPGTFKLPTGVVVSDETEEALDPTELSAGYTKEIDESGLCFLEINVDADNLITLYSRILNLNEDYRVFWYQIHDHWDESSGDQFFTNTDLNAPHKILRHLRENSQNSIENGYVSLTAMLREGETNIRISDHKRIIISTYSEKVVGKVERLLEFNRYSLHTELLSIDSLMAHWHYCLPQCLERAELISHLESIGFSDWDPNG